MRISPIFLCLIALALLIIPSSAVPDPFSGWSASGTCWTATNDTYTIRMFNTTGFDSFTIPSGVSSIDYIVVAGGGSGAAYGGGGGSGGVYAGRSLSVTAGNTYVVTIGAGGASTTASGQANPGQNSSFANTTPTNGLQAMRGGAGNDNTLGTDIYSNGGSGGGGNLAGASNPGGSGLAGQGKDGGTGDGNNNGGGGGGGNATVGGNGATNGGAGGSGYDYSWFLNNAVGTNKFAGGGGGVSISGTVGAGTDGGGNGAKWNSADATSATTYGSGGGGGGGSVGSHWGKAGFQGVVMIKYQTSSSIPIVQFTITNTSGAAPYITNLTDTSLNTPTDWNWTGYNTGNSTEFIIASTQYRTQWFGEAGNYSILLNVSNTAGYNKSTLYQSGHWVNVSAAAPSVLAPIVNWSVSPVTLIFPGRVTFNDTSLYDGTHNPTSYNYTPGDGNVNVSLGLRNVSYQYYKRGLWNATLNVSNSAGYNITYQWVRVIGYQG